MTETKTAYTVQDVMTLCSELHETLKGKPMHLVMESLATILGSCLDKVDRKDRKRILAALLKLINPR